MSAPLIVHVIHRLAVGGLENGLVNLINQLPAAHYRHAIISLTDASAFRERITRTDVDIYTLHRAPGIQPALYWQLYRLFRRLRPSLVHTRNLATLEAQLPAWLAGVPVRVHGEHGRDMHDLDNQRNRYRRMRRILSPLVDGYIALSRELEAYLVDTVGIDAARVTRICNGVDTARFRVRGGPRTQAPWPAGFAGADAIVIGSVGRMEAVKDPVNLATAFVQLCAAQPVLAGRLRLVMIGDGGQRAAVEAVLEAAGLQAQVWLPGSRDDVPDCLAALDVFVLPSLAEGISNTVLEAMACGLPVVATAVGGNRELVEPGVSGLLVPRADAAALAEALAAYCQDPALRAAHGTAGRQRVETEFSLRSMVDHYAAFYDRLLAGEQKKGEGRRAA